MTNPKSIVQMTRELRELMRQEEIIRTKIVNKILQIQERKERSTSQRIQNELNADRLVGCKPGERFIQGICRKSEKK